MVTLLAPTRFARTLDRLLLSFERLDPAGTRFEAWTFDDQAARRAGQERLATLGVAAKLRSAYKPLLHFFLEEVDRTGLAEVRVRYPVHPLAAPKRFRLETYPLAGLLGGAALRFEPTGHPGLEYEVALRYADGRHEAHRVFAPNRAHVDPTGARHLSPTGWLRVEGDRTGGERLETEFERLFETAIRAIARHDWGASEPYFEELSIRATLPFRETPLAVGEETISLAEALHEDLYFAALEIFAHKANRAPGDRGVRPGQIVPEVAVVEGEPTLRIATRRFADAAAEPEALGPRARLATAGAPLPAAAVAAELARIGGAPFAARSRTGRTVAARHLSGTDRPMLISGGQHANEPSGIVGALRGAQILRLRPGAHFTVAPVENPDGQALHLRLCRENPRHMHHAARYTAFGDDLGHRPPDGEPGEHAIRAEAVRRAGNALLHLNLHGYPAHEWTRPLSGYAPRGFANWTLPQGFFLIMHHRDGWEDAASWVVEAVTKRLGLVLPGLLAFTQEQIALHRIHSGEPGLSLVNGFPCRIGADPGGGLAPMTLVTEYPDETIHGNAFVAAHTAQTETVLAAYDALQALGAGT